MVGIGAGSSTATTSRAGLSSTSGGAAASRMSTIALGGSRYLESGPWAALGEAKALDERRDQGEATILMARSSNWGGRREGIVARSTRVGRSGQLHHPGGSDELP